MSAHGSKAEQATEGDVSQMRASSPTSDDLREYLPQDTPEMEAYLDEVMRAGQVTPDPALVEKLRRMNETEAKPRAPAEEEAKPVVKPAEAKAAPRARKAMAPAVKVLAAVLSVLVPVTTVVVLVGREMDRKIAAAMDGGRGATVGMSVSAGGAPSVSTAAAPSANASAAAVPSAMASAGPSQPIKPHGKPRATSDDPYDGAVPAPPKTAEPATSSSAPTPEPEPTSTRWF